MTAFGYLFTQPIFESGNYQAAKVINTKATQLKAKRFRRKHGPCLCLDSDTPAIPTTTIITLQMPQLYHSYMTLWKDTNQTQTLSILYLAWHCHSLWPMMADFQWDSYGAGLAFLLEKGVWSWQTLLKKGQLCPRLVLGRIATMNSFKMKT